MRASASGSLRRINFCTRLSFISLTPHAHVKRTLSELLPMESTRDISKAAKRGPNFVQQMLKNGKEPGADNLATVLDALGPDASLYVLTGLRLTQEDRQFLALLSRIDGDQKRKARAFFEAMLEPAGSREQVGAESPSS